MCTQYMSDTKTTQAAQSLRTVICCDHRFLDSRKCKNSREKGNPNILTQKPHKLHKAFGLSFVVIIGGWTQGNARIPGKKETQTYNAFICMTS